MTSSFSSSPPILALVATTRFLLLADLCRKTVVPLEGDRPEYYGISWFPGSKDLALSHSMLDNARLVDLPSYVQSEVGCVSFGRRLSEPFLSAPHQILCASDGRLVCTNTGRNAITVIDPSRPGHFQEARISPSRWDRLSLDHVPGDHLNSVFEKDGKLYVIAHRHNKGSALATFRYPELELLNLEPVVGRTGLHNVWVTAEGQKIACHSSAGSLMDLSTGENLWESGSHVYTRGLAAASDFILIGESQLVGRDLRGGSLSALWVIDRRTRRELDYFCLGPFGTVHEVRLLNVPDEAHHGHPFADVETLQRRDMRVDLAATRMRNAGLAHKALESWRGFDLVFGTPEVGEDGVRTAPPDLLCLAVQRETSEGKERKMAFRYCLDSRAAQSHVSAVFDYRGKGEDRDMAALLLQPSGDSAHLSLWRHDGSGWLSDPAFGVGGLPLGGVLAVKAGKRDLEVFAGSRRILKVPADVFPWQGGGWGIRWIGATVCPERPGEE